MKIHPPHNYNYFSIVPPHLRFQHPNLYPRIMNNMFNTIFNNLGVKSTNQHYNLACLEKNFNIATKLTRRSLAKGKPLEPFKKGGRQERIITMYYGK